MTTPTHYNFRRARSDDAHAISVLAFNSKKHWGYDDAFMSSCRAELTYTRQQISAPEFDFQVCESSQDIVAFYALEYLDRNVAELEALFVSPEYIGNGIGTLLIEHAVASANHRGIEKIVIQGDPHAAQFYLSVGAIRRAYRESDSIPGRTLPLFEIILNGVRP